MRRLFVVSLVLGALFAATPVRAQVVTSVTWSFSPPAPTFTTGQSLAFLATVKDQTGTAPTGTVYIESISGPLAEFYNNTAASNQVGLNPAGQATLTAPARIAPGSHQVKVCYKESASAGSLCTVNALAITITAATSTGTPSSSGAAGTEPTKKSEIVFDPEIPIPFFSGGPVDGTTFAKYVRAIFVGFIWSVGVLAVVMVIFGGIRWVAAAGNPARINMAKDIVFNAIIGLVIALTSVVLLSLLDPKLVNFEGLTATTQLAVKGIPYEMDTLTGEFNEGATCKTAGGNPVQPENTCFFIGTKLLWPVANVPPIITSRIGPRTLAGVGSSCHPGTDFSTAKTSNRTIVAPHDGVITEIQPSQKCGEYIMKLVTDDFYIRFVHVKSTVVSIGQHVTSGQTLGYTGGDPKDNSAIASCSGGPHLHVELYSTSGELHDIYPCLQ